VASVGGGLVVAFLGLRPDFVIAAGTLAFQAHTTLVAVAMVMAARAALVLAVPGEELTSWRGWTPIAAVAGWALWLSSELGAAATGSAAAWTVDAGWGCVAKSIATAAAPGAALFVMLSRGATLDLYRSVMFAALASAGVGALGVEFLCPKIEAMHLIVWHLGPVMVWPVAAGLAGAPLFAMWIRRRDAYGLR
ncbi:MAG: NrsF family protein, partial [Vicinamibacterales bacterium]